MGNKEVDRTGKGECGSEMDVESAEPQHTSAHGAVTAYFRLLSTSDSLDKLLMAVGLGGAIANGLAWPAFSILFADFTDSFGDPSTSDFTSSVNKVALYFLYLGAGSAAVSVLEVGCWKWTGFRQTNRLRQRFLSSLLRQDLTFFDVEATTGGMIHGLNEDALLVQAGISEKVGNFVKLVVTFIAGFGIAFWAGWDLALVMMGCLPFLGVVGGLLARLMITSENKNAAAYAKANGIAQQNISQIRTVAAYGREDMALKQYQETLIDPLKVGIRQALYNGMSIGSVNAIFYCTWAAAFFYGAYRVASGSYDPGDVLTSMVAALIGGFNLGMAAPQFQHFVKAQASGRRLFKIIDRQPAISIDTSGQTPQKVEGELQFTAVNFAYPARPDVTVLRDFTMKFPAGATVALVGSSGSGKSTVIGLIERFYDPKSGTIALDGIDIRELQLIWLRNNVGLVSQEPTLFAITIADNIALGKPGCSRSEIEAAAKSANAHNFVRALPKGYETHVGERGLQLSGGQKQRIAIARAILKNPRILLLDEGESKSAPAYAESTYASLSAEAYSGQCLSDRPLKWDKTAYLLEETLHSTSALDTRSEKTVQKALDGLMRDRSTVVVAHRISTVRNADIIAVVSNGSIVEQGRHDTLITNENGAYTTLVKLQMQQEQKEEEEKVQTEEDDVDDKADETITLEVDAGGVANRLETQQSSGPTQMLNGVTTLAPSTRGAAAVENVNSAVDALQLALTSKPSLESATSLNDPKFKMSGADNIKPGAKKVNVSAKRLAGLSKPEGGYALLGAFGAAFQGSLSPVFGLIMSSVILVLYYPDPDRIRNRAHFYARMFLVIAIATIITSTVSHYCFGKMGHRLAYRLRQLILAALLRQEIGWFDLDENSSGKLTSYLGTDALHIRGAVGDALGLICQNLSCLAAGFIIAYVYDWRMALLVTALLPFLASAGVIENKSMLGMSGNLNKMYADANQIVTESLASMRIVQAYNLQAHTSSLYSNFLDVLNRIMGRQSLVSGVALAYTNLVNFGIYGLVIWFGGIEVDRGWTDFDDMLKAYFAIVLGAMGIAQAQLDFPHLSKAQTAIQHLFPILDRKSLIDASNGDGLQPANIEGTIELRKVAFAYPSRPIMIFRDFSLMVPAGQTLALVGESGSGKSTVVGLVERFYDPTNGCVLLDGIDLKQYNLKWLRSRMSLVSQEPLLFSGTILDNICYGRPNATFEDVVEAANTANAHSFIEALPDAYQTSVGEQGIQLSGGQKQRVAIARAVIRNPRILLMDEATSALDARSEQVVQEALNRIMVGRTSIVIAHRLSTIRHADVIALVVKGTILEQGNHEELMKVPDGGYAQLVNAQHGRTAS